MTTTTTQSEQPKMAAVQDQGKPKIIDVPGSARALSTALEQKLEGELFIKSMDYLLKVKFSS